MDMKKILILILVTFLYIGSVNALKVVSLGDSIPNGYLLSDSNNSFDNMFADALGADYYEFSYIGMRSDDLLRELEQTELKRNIEDADIIIINIGANDLLDLLDYIDLSKVGIEYEYGSMPQIYLNSEFINNLKTYLQDFFVNELKPKAVEAANDFAIIFPLIIEKIKKYNPNVRIIVNNLYNPFFNISVPLLKMDLSYIEQTADEAIQSYNDIININSGYEIIDVYNTLRNNNYLNVNPTTLSFDPHPNIKGHRKIYELYLKELCYKVTYDNKDYYVLKNGSIDIKPKKKPGYKFVKWNYDLNNVDKDIELKAIYKFDYLYIVVLILVVVTAVVLILRRKKL